MKKVLKRSDGVMEYWSTGIAARTIPPLLRYSIAPMGFLCVLFASAVILFPGCANQPRLSGQVGFQPLGHDNRVADQMRAGDDQAAGRDLTKVHDSSTTRTQNLKIQGETVRVSGAPTVLALTVTVTLALAFAFAIFSFDRWIFYRKLAVLQADAISRGTNREEILGIIRPRVQRLGRRRKRAFDRLLWDNGCLMTRGTEH